MERPFLWQIRDDDHPARTVPFIITVISGIHCIFACVQSWLVICKVYSLFIHFGSFHPLQSFIGVAEVMGHW